MNTAIMTDTNSGITEVVAKELGIYVIHMPIIINDETFYEGNTITESEFSLLLSIMKTSPHHNPPLEMSWIYGIKFCRKDIMNLFTFQCRVVFPIPAPLLWDMHRIMKGK